MDDHAPSRSDVLLRLQAHEAELRACGVESLTLFGSVARDDAIGSSDVDVAIKAGDGFSTGGFDYFGRLEALREQLADLLGRNVDVVVKPVLNDRLREVIRQEGVRAF